jgi:hypothetical protein
MTTHNIVNLNNSSATRISPNGTHSGLDITIQNINEDGYVYVGGEGVTSSNYGYRISPEGAISFELAEHDALYLTSSASAMQASIITLSLEEGY